MAVFTVHVPPGVAETGRRADRTVFVREGFSWAAFLFGPLALLYRRLWLAALAWVVVAGAIAFASAALKVPGPATAALLGLLALLTGLEAGTLRQAALNRRGFFFAALLVSPSRDAAEQTFFNAVAARPPVPRPAGAGRTEATDVIGLFPEAGAGA